MKRIIDPFRILSHKHFRLFSIGMFISFIGSQMQVVGISWHLYEITKSAYSLGIIGVIGFLPILLFSPFGGVIVDAFDRKKLLIINQIIFAVLSGVFAFLTFYNYSPPLLLYLVIGLTSVINIIDMPLRQAIIPSIVPKEQLMHALNVNTIIRQSATIVGPALAGYIIAYYHVWAVYAFNACSFLFLLATVLPVTLRTEEKKYVPVSFASLLEGIRYVKNSPLLYSMMLLDFFANFFAASTVIFPIFAAEVLHIPTKDIGLLYAAPSVGAVLTGMLVGLFSHVKHQGKFLLWVVTLYGAATIGFGLSRSFAFSLFCLAIVGSADMISMVIRRTLSQLVTPDHIRGRMNSINMMFFAGGPFLGEAEAGFLAGLVGAPMSVIIGGLGAIASVGIIAVAVPKLTQYTLETEKK